MPLQKYLRRPGHYSAILARRLAYFLRTGYLHTEERDNPDFAGVHYERHLRVYEFLLPLVRERAVLDVGCGCGAGSNLLAGSARQVTGIDRSRMALRFGRRRWSSAGNLRFIHMDAEQLVFPPESFDLAMSNENIEHLANIDAHLECVRRVLRADGCYFIGTPNPAATVERNRFHHHEYSPAEMSALLRKYFRTVQLVGNENTCRVKGTALDARLLANEWSYFLFALDPIR